MQAHRQRDRPGLVDRQRQTWVGRQRDRQEQVDRHGLIDRETDIGRYTNRETYLVW